MMKILRQYYPLWNLKAYIKTMLVVSLFIIPILVLVVLVSFIFGIRPYYLINDPARIQNYPVYIGIISNLGLLLWSATIGICLFTGFTLIKLGDTSRISLFLIISGVLTALLLSDDYLQLHERVIPGLLHIIDEVFFEKITYSLYGITFVLFFLYFRKIIFEKEFLLFITVLGFFGMSTLFDMAPFHFEGIQVLEEGCKLIGITTWLAYFIRLSFNVLSLKRESIQEIK